MKKLFPIFGFALLLFFSSCQTLVVSQQKPLKDNSLELYQNYTIQTQEAKEVKMKVLKIDDTKIYGKNKKGENLELAKKDIRQVRKLNLLASVGIAVVAIAAVIFVPI
jgi:hypothetical protein